MGRSYVGEGADIRILQAWCHALSALFAQELRDLHYSNTESFAGPKKTCMLISPKMAQPKNNYIFSWKAAPAKHDAWSKKPHVLFHSGRFQFVHHSAGFELSRDEK